MAIDHIALVVSIGSALIACLSLGWNIYRDIVLKARVDVSFAIVTLLHPSSPEKPQYLNLKVVNFGPGPITISMICAKNTSFWMRLRKRTKRAVIQADYGNPMSAKPPVKIEVGDKVELFLPYDKDCFLSHPFTHVGVTDYYGRKHWASRRDFKEAYEAWKKDFPRET